MADPEQVARAKQSLGRKLASLRAGAGMSQHALARAVHYTRSTIANVEVGRQNAPSNFWSRCDDVLAADGHLRAGYEAVQRLRASARRRAAEDLVLPGRVALPASGERLPVAYIPFLPGELDGLALEWLLDEAPTRAQPTTSHHVDLGDVARAAARLDHLRYLDHAEGAGGAYWEAEEFIDTDLRRLLAGRPADAGVLTELYRVAAGSYELVGYQAVDLGADGLAQRHYVRALTLTRAIGDRAFGAYLLAVSLGHLALHCGYPLRSLRMARAAIRGVSQQTSPAVRAAMHAVAARAHARLGEESACTAELRTAESSLARSDPVTEPHWISYLTAAYLADEVAHCQFDLGRHEAAQREVRQAIAGVGSDRVRRLAIDTALLASSLARAGTVDEACEQGRRAVDLAAGIGSMRGVQRVAQLRVELAPYVVEPEVAEFVEYVRATLPSAA
jgi:hypothetical protein